MSEKTVEEVYKNKDSLVLVDVREPFELKRPEGQIKGAISAAMSDGLISFLKTADPSKEYVFICSGGYRSLLACVMARSMGFKKVHNMKGGMKAWNKKFDKKSQILH